MAEHYRPVGSVWEETECWQPQEAGLHQEAAPKGKRRTQGSQTTGSSQWPEGGGTGQGAGGRLELKAGR